MPRQATRREQVVEKRFDPCATGSASENLCSGSIQGELAEPRADLVQPAPDRPVCGRCISPIGPLALQSAATIWPFRLDSKRKRPVPNGSTPVTLQDEIRGWLPYRDDSEAEQSRECAGDACNSDHDKAFESRESKSVERAHRTATRRDVDLLAKLLIDPRHERDTQLHGHVGLRHETDSPGLSGGGNDWMLAVRASIGRKWGQRSRAPGEADQLPM